MPFNLTTLSSCDKKRYCKCCFKEIKVTNLHTLLFRDICLCDKCLDELAPKLIKKKINGVSGTFMYFYNDAVKEKIYLLKGCGDIEMNEIFLNYFLLELRLKYRGYVIVTAPSSASSDSMRGFNHVKMIAQNLHLPIADVLVKTEDYKQANLSQKERYKTSQKIVIKNTSLIHHKKVLFIDDVYTTGTTLQTCLKLIKTAKIKKLKFLIIAMVLRKK